VTSVRTSVAAELGTAKNTPHFGWNGSEVEQGCSREAEGDRLLARNQKLGRSWQSHFVGWERAGVRSGMAGLWGTGQRGISLGCRLKDTSPYSPKALFEFHLSWML